MKLFVFLLVFIPCLLQAGEEQDKTLKVHQLTDRVYQFVSYKTVKPWGLVGASGLVVVEGKEAHLIDTPWTTAGTQALIAWTKQQGLTIKSAVVSHFHDDSSNDLALLNQLKIDTYATALTNELLRAENKATAQFEITEGEQDLPNSVMSVFYPGAGHSRDNVVVWMPQDKLLFGGCFVKSLRSKHLGYTGDAVVSAWPSSIQNVLDRYPNIEVVVPGHGKVGDKSLLTHTQQLALAALDKTK